MRRGFSIFLILLFGLGPLSAMIDGSEDASLPPCCRRHGAHHCAMAMRMAAMMAKMQRGSTPVLTAPLTCPYYPGAQIALLMPAHALTATRTRLPVLRARLYTLAAVCMAPLSSPGRTHAGRGPPAETIS